MSELPSNLDRQKRTGYVMLAGAVTILIASIAVFQYYDVPPISYLGPLVPVGILAAFGYRAVSASNDRRALGDERTVAVFGKVSINAFWWLIAILLIDGTFDVLPEDGSNGSYVFAGLAIYGLYYAYYRYIG